jgi:hypothetical protein
MWSLIFLALEIGVSSEFSLIRYSLFENKSDCIGIHFKTQQLLINSYSKDDRSRAKKPGCLHYGVQWWAETGGMMVGVGIGATISNPFGLIEDPSPIYEGIINFLMGAGAGVGTAAGVTLLGNLMDLEGSFLKSIIGAGIGMVPVILAGVAGDDFFILSMAVVCIPTGAVIGYHWK